MNKQEMKPNLRRTYRADSFLHGSVLEFFVDGREEMDDAAWLEIAEDELNYQVRNSGDWVIGEYGDETELEEN
jgi:hypothetical protein